MQSDNNSFYVLASGFEFCWTSNFKILQLWLKFSWNSIACRVSCSRYSLLWLTVTRGRFCTEIWNQAMCWLIIPKGWSSWRISVWLESLQMTCYILRRYIDWEGTFLFWFVVSSLFLMFWYSHSIINFTQNYCLLHCFYETQKYWTLQIFLLCDVL